MRPVRSVHLNDKGAKVRDLHHCLLFLIAHQGGISDSDREILRKRLAPEVHDATFGPATADLVFLWQDQITHTSSIPAGVRNPVVMNRDVDKATADALNWLLRHLGALPAVGAQPAAQEYQGIPKSVLKRLGAALAAT